MAKKTTKYNIILKAFTKINNKLPEDRKLSIKARRSIIKEILLPKYVDTPKYKLRIKDINNTITKVYQKLPPKEICDLNYLDLSTYGFIEWFSLDETISQLVPDCVYARVTAGEYGQTRIFNTRNYDYSRNGVRTIVERIRPDADNTSGGQYIFTGYKKLRPRKANDGTPENYFLDFVLNYIDDEGNTEAMGDTEEVVYKTPRTKENKRKKTKIRNVIEAKIKSLKVKKDKKRRAKKTAATNISKLNKTLKKKKLTPSQKIAANKQFIKTANLLEKYLKHGIITKEEYKNMVKKMNK